MSSTPERRELSFATLNDVVAEAERLASGEGSHDWQSFVRPNPGTPCPNPRHDYGET